jgi:hypothetical protein
MSNFIENTGNSRIVRTMPNTPATIQKGMTVWACSDEVTHSQRNSVAKFLSSLGEQHFVHDEVYLDMATAVSGSGPGYVLLILEALIDAGTWLLFWGRSGRKGARRGANFRSCAASFLAYTVIIYLGSTLTFNHSPSLPPSPPSPHSGAPGLPPRRRLETRPPNRLRHHGPRHEKRAPPRDPPQ